MVEEEFRETLLKERESVLKQRETVDKRLEAIDLLLEQPPSGLNGATAPTAEVVRPAHRSPGSGHTGLRSQIVEVLTNHPQGLKPREITFELEKQGYRHQGATKLSMRVATEVNRMLKTGQLKRTARTRKYKVRGKVQGKEP